MALQKSITTVHGVQANYWKISYIEISKKTDTAIIVLSLYKNKAESDAGSEPLLSKEYEFHTGSQSGANPFNHSNLNPENTNVFTVSYNRIKTIDQTLSDATNVLEAGQNPGQNGGL